MFRPAAHTSLLLPRHPQALLKLQESGHITQTSYRGYEHHPLGLQPTPGSPVLEGCTQAGAKVLAQRGCKEQGLLPSPWQPNSTGREARWFISFTCCQCSSPGELWLSRCHRQRLVIFHLQGVTGKTG